MKIPIFYFSLFFLIADFSLSSVLYFRLGGLVPPQYVTQTIEIRSNDITFLNKKLQWQLNNKFRKLKYVQFDQNILRFVIFTNSSFANNRNLFFQIDYVICLIDESGHVNFVHWCFIKCKRIIRNVLTSELYVMIHEFDVNVVIKTIFEKMFRINVFFIFCIDFKFLYDCLVRLGTINEKRFMIDVMNLKQSYEKRKVIEIKWIDDKSNSVDSMIKSKTSSALKTLIDINKINLISIE